MTHSERTIKSEKPRSSDPSLIAFQTIDAISTNCGRLIRYGAIVLIVRYVYFGVVVLAGKSTNANFFLQLLANVHTSQVLGAGLGGSGVIYGWKQRSLRKRAVAGKSERIRELERIIYPDRQSSGLPPNGSTRPEDE